MNTARESAAAVNPDPLTVLEDELRTGLRHYWRCAGEILRDGPVHLIEPDEASLSLPGNFFSALFMYSYYRTGIAKDRRILYAAVNQCLRGMVTGCDNILDDEYKKTLDTDLPHQARRFRSVLDIMVSDRILTEVLLDYCLASNLPLDKLVKAGRASLHTLLQSGVQEASEEGGIAERLRPEEILSRIHHYKTGVLFQCPWAIPAVFEETISPEAPAVQGALYDIGIGCQILDDLVDLVTDLRENRHNFVLSAVFHEEPPQVWRRLESMPDLGGSADEFYGDFPEFHVRMKARALDTLAGGLRNLFFAHHGSLVEPAIAFIAGRIGVRLGQG